MYLFIENSIIFEARLTTKRSQKNTEAFASCSSGHNTSASLSEGVTLLAFLVNSIDVCDVLLPPSDNNSFFHCLVLYRCP